jgi:hypothetical protein
LVNQLRFFNQASDRATKLESSLKYDLLKRFTQKKSENTQIRSRSGHTVGNYTIINESSLILVNQLPFFNQGPYGATKLISSLKNVIYSMALGKHNQEIPRSGLGMAIQ